ncbi:MAG: DUF1173 family protein [Hydrogenophaga sp.]|nr:DUF1173 family protein [Hydrogenophaga sp.]
MSRDLVRIAGVVLHRTVREDDPDRWQRLLGRAVRSGVRPECLCQGQARALPMVVAEMGRVLFLKRMPNSGQDHHPTCESHGGNERRGPKLGDRRNALQKLGSGLLDVHLDVPLSTVVGAGGGDGKAEGRPLPQSGVPGRGELSLLGLLHLVWERAGLNAWGADAGQVQRRLSSVYNKLAQEVQELAIAGKPASERWFVPDAHLDATAMTRKREAMDMMYMHLQSQEHHGRRPVLMVSGEVRNIFQSAYGYGLRLKGLPDDRPIWLTTSSMDRLQRSWPSVTQWIGGKAEESAPAAKAFLMAGVQASREGNFNWVYGAWMDLSDDYIPVDSRYERTVAEALVRQVRSFYKPLRYDHSAQTHPDFVLTDATPGGVVMEVYGMQTPEYLARKREKTRIYREEGRMTWEWNASQGVPMPAFPGKRQERTNLSAL